MTYTVRDELCSWACEQGFRIAGSENVYDWYGFRPTKLVSRDCERRCKNVELLLSPRWRDCEDQPIGSWVRVDVELFGEYRGILYTFKAENIRQECILTRLDEIEESLIRSWNALEHKEPE